MAGAVLVGAQADAMKLAAANEGAGGAVMGFMGMGLAGQAGGMNAQNLFAMDQQQQMQQQQMQQQPMQQQPMQQAAAGWTCACGHAGNTGKFCSECAKPAPQADWVCRCGAMNTGKFCSECAAPRP